MIGDAVNVASRMGGLGRGRELIMPRETFELLGDGFDFAPVGECEIKGVSRKIEAGVVTAVSAPLLLDIDAAVSLAFEDDLSQHGPRIVGQSDTVEQAVGAADESDKATGES